MCEKKPNVIITGFGPFGEHSVNNSWECVRSIKSSDFERRNKINLIIREIPVIYDKADEIVPKLWEDHDPILVVHVGVHGGDQIIIEKTARNHGYVKNDVSNNLPADGKCSIGCEQVLETRFDVEELKCNDIVCSTNAGRFLCEYTYYLSLSKNRNRTLFVHVPPCTSSMLKDDIVEKLCLIIEKCLNQTDLSNTD